MWYKINFKNKGMYHIIVKSLKKQEVSNDLDVFVHSLKLVPCQV